MGGLSDRSECRRRRESPLTRIRLMKTPLSWESSVQQRAISPVRPESSYSNTRAYRPQDTAISNPASQCFISISFQQKRDLMIRQTQLLSNHPPKRPVVPSQWVTEGVWFAQPFVSHLRGYTKVLMLEGSARLSPRPSTVILWLRSWLPLHVVHHASPPVGLLRTFTKRHPVPFCLWRCSSVLPYSPLHPRQGFLMKAFWFRMYRMYTM